MMPEPVELIGQVGPIPHFDPPGLAVRAVFLATDGSRPQEITLEWRHDPGPDILTLALNTIAEMAAPSDVVIETDRNRPAVPGRPAEDHPLCREIGPGHDGPGHGCVLPPGHEPVEPEGRRHRCLCGGIFGTEAEHPSTPGRRSRERRDR